MAKGYRPIFRTETATFEFDGRSRLWRLAGGSALLPHRIVGSMPPVPGQEPVGDIELAVAQMYPELRVGAVAVGVYNKPGMTPKISPRNPQGLVTLTIGDSFRARHGRRDDDYFGASRLFGEFRERQYDATFKKYGVIAELYVPMVSANLL